ncbi:winged helix-turn-helix domain-containing protein [Ancylobacter sp. 6x-1]|uniref:Winged helix-turn-helix domain-containing protein n=1 Tax=Ancylobacter crimeensis TaxID=2579147 RepID=A0ABT0D8G9_9HYPH|nr:winged helix-turn-helix domain-containing protein [Ancylobacter crimeensis]MCK0196237.1 winged helix-turn-helix domain-containing protein [Ancylobacter crimeensis]
MALPSDDPVPAPRARLSLKEARRLALAAQGFGSGHGGAERAHVHTSYGPMRRMADRLGLLQIDSVNVLVRSHYLPLFSRLGPYPMERLDAATQGRRRILFEYWGHEASLLPVALQPLMRWRMERAARGHGIYGGLARFAREQADYIEAVREEIRTRGPLGAGELSDGSKGEGGWWGWSAGKQALEFLFWAGEVTTAQRRGFERVYDLTERVLPAEVLAAPTVPAEEAQRQLVMVAARALGVATEPCLRDYFRLDPTESKARVAELVEDGRLLPVAVEGWSRPAYLDPAQKIPRRIGARALLSPFDSLIFERRRTQELFGFHYRLAFYTPADKRSHGYYVMPLLLGDRLVARIDVKAERATGVLSVPAAHIEDGVAAGEVVEPLAEELRLLAFWLGLPSVHVGERGDLANPLRELFGRG